MADLQAYVKEISRSRRHTPHSLQDFKENLLKRYVCYSNTEDCSNMDVQDEELSITNDGQGNDDDVRDLPNIIEKNMALLFLKLESKFNVSNKCIDEIIEELHFITETASGPLIKEILQSCLRKNNCEIDESVVSDMVTELCEANPFTSTLCSGGSLSSAYKRRAYFREQFAVVEPVEYALSREEDRSFQYVPILKSLLQAMTRKEIQDLILHDEKPQGKDGTQYRAFCDGIYYKTNELFSGEDPTIAIILYIDDFEICNPLGTSRKKHKVTAVYWVIADIPAQLRSSLTSIFLAILCKADDVKRFGYSTVLEPLLKDLVSLEEEGLYVPALGRKVKGTVFSIVADNLGAHSVGGFVENFCSSYFCRFCLAEQSEFQVSEVRTGAFQPRITEQHEMHIQNVQENPALTHVCGVKRQCALTENLKYFNVLTGYPPDLLHDLFEGIVPRELALCLQVFIKSKYFTLDELNKNIKTFPYKWSDKTDAPQQVSLNFAAKKSVGGNAHENWSLLRFLPLIIGSKIPEGEPAWEVLLVLKDIAELVVSHVHTEESICYLDSKISEHRHRFLQVFPHEKLIPKHHYLEHYPQLIRAYGPLVLLWTMRFEAKHSFFKRVVRHTHSFRNILLSLSMKHQLMMAYNQHDPSAVKTCLAGYTTVYCRCYCAKRRHQGSTAC
ncbi:uncharacterized protein LOC102293912 isoform X2 [Haplochromis burtoni]|uniref:uncharacterized protein LOC102293912 isoform X2 n=1 Tax=Haplochromis burtoni TaxID=8153 RepID=UPI001C2CE09F|nr:uncharacterized protein LOC102293912 isoform X2 [Haplochromis burtoni]